MKLIPLALVALLALPACRAEAPKADAGASPNPNGVSWSKNDKRWTWVGFGTVSPGRPIALAPVPAKVAPLESATWSIQAPLEGRIEQVLSRVGQPVHRGEALVRVRSTALADLRHDQILADQTLTLRRNQARHAATLADAHAIAEKDLLGAQQDLREAELNQRTSRDKLSALGVEPTGYSSYVIRAPQDGVVVAAGMNPGQEVGPDKNPLLTLAKLEQLVVTAQVLESELAHIRVGDTARVLAPGRADLAVPARVDAIARAVDPDQHTVGVRLLTTGPTQGLLPNGFVQVQFDRGGSTAIVVPSEAVVTDDLDSVVFVKQGEHLERRKVVTGSQSHGQIEVVRGLTPGEQIVTRGAILVLNEVNP